jgi:predicted esterase
VLLVLPLSCGKPPSSGAAIVDAGGSTEAPLDAGLLAVEDAAPSGGGGEDADLNTEGWCTEGLRAIDPETCVVVPDDIASPRTLLVYLHGTIAPTGGTQAVVQQIVRANAQKRGYVALLPRGRRGIGPNKIQDWWAWPTSRDAHLSYARQMVESWLAKKRDLEAELGAPFEKTFLGGSSNGAYFLSVLALRGEIDVDGFGAFSGGSRSGFTAERVTAASRPPFYVGYGAYDDTKDLPIALGELLRQLDWPSEVRAHRVSHGAHEVYLDEAMDFWGGPGRERRDE